MKHFFKSIALLLGYCISAHANLIVVNSNQDAAIDDGLCTLKEALVAANFDVPYFGCSTGLGDDIIWLLLGTTNDSIVVNTTFPIIEGVEIQGPGADNLVLIPANGFNGHIFQINTSDDVTFKDFRIGGSQSSAIDVVEVGDLTIENMKLLGNSAGNNENGGALAIDQALVTFSDNRIVSIINSEFSGNQAIKGGAIYIDEDYLLTVEDSLFQNNSLIDVPGIASYGSAIGKNSDDLNFASRDPDSIVNSQFIGNSLVGPVRNVLSFSKLKYTIDSTAFIDNHATPFSAGSGLGLIKNSLFSGNTGLYAIYTSSSTSELTVQFSTFVDNVTAIGASNFATVYIEGNVFDTDGCKTNITNDPGTITSLGYNIEYNNANFVACTSEPSDIPNTDPLLLPVATYGGTVPIAPLSPISPAVDAASGCDAIDLSGEGRPRDGDASGTAQCDMGAVERPAAHNLSLDFIGSGSGQVNLIEFDMVCYTTEVCDWPLEQGLTFLLEPVADNGSQFIGWTGACSGNGNCLVTMNSAKNVTAEYALVNTPVTLTLSKFRSEHYQDATVSSDPLGISCGATCSFDFNSNETVVLTANPQPDTVIDYWDNCHDVSVDGLSCTIHLGSMDEEVNLYLDTRPDVIFKDSFDH